MEDASGPNRRSLLVMAGLAPVALMPAALPAAPSGSTESAREPIIDPDLPIIDPHHHLWDHSGPTYPKEDPGREDFRKLLARFPRFLLEEMLAATNSGHNVRATVFAQGGSMYREGGLKAMKPIGETEFANGIAAMSASGAYGTARIADGIIGFADLELGTRVEEVLHAHLAAAGPRFKGIRYSGAHDADPAVLGLVGKGVPADRYERPAFRAGLAKLAPLGLSFDSWMLEPQLPAFARLASDFPETTMILNHLGTPLGVGRYMGKRAERFTTWRSSIRDLARRPNVAVKLGGLGMSFSGFASYMAARPATSEQLAVEWRPYIETCIEAFGVDRCMFESNYPTDGGTADYATIWNTFKRIASGASSSEKTALFSGTAARIYRLFIN